ncbi:MAG TPA: PKD domain-containing protein [Fulvivirga sp.]|nr:PKD domain-containing protein [Fulvivirga sp.]
MMASYRILHIGILLVGVIAKSNAQIHLIENKGQYPKEYHSVGNIPGGKVFFKPNGLIYDFNNMPSHEEIHGVDDQYISESCEQYQAHSYAVNFQNANPNVEIAGEGAGPQTYNYFVGAKDKWATAAKDFDEIKYSNIYTGIDFRYYKYGMTVKYDFIISPNGHPEDILLNIDGAEWLGIDAKGDLQISTSVNEIRETRPVAYQIIEGKKMWIPCEFQLTGNSLSFNILGDYDDCEELIIDPTLIFSTFSGSTADNWGNTATFDSGGNLYSGGISSNYSGGSFPTTTGAYQINNQGQWDVAIIKYDSTGSTALYATYLGGQQSEIPQSLIVNDKNELFIMGFTGSANFPAVNAYQPVFKGGINVSPLAVPFPNGSDIFISKLSANGQNLLSSTFIGGTNNDGLMSFGDALTRNYGDESRGDIFIKENGNILVASKTSSFDFPLMNPIQSFYGGGTTDAVLFEMSSDLSNLIFSSYIGGSAMDAAYSIKTNSNNKIIVAGGTNSTNINSNIGEFSDSSNGGVDGWISIIDNGTYELDTGVYIGTSSYDQVYFIDIDIDDNIYSYGQSAGDFPILGNVYTSGGGQFIQKWNSSLTDLKLSTKFGSPGNLPDISPTAFLVNDCDNIYISGWGGITNGNYNGGSTNSMPITSDAYQSTTVGSDFYLMTLSANAESLLYATYLGGTQSRTHVDGGTSRFDKRGIVYHAVCSGCQAGNPAGAATSDFPTTPNAWSNTNNSKNCNNAAFKFDLATLRAIIQTNNVTFNQPGISIICFPDDIVFENYSVGGEIFEWNFGDGTNTTATDTIPIAHNYKSAGVYKITLKAIDPNTCVGEDITSVNVRVSKPSFSTVEDALICEGSSFRLGAFGGNQYFWHSLDSAFTSEERAPLVAPEVSTTYLVRVIDDLGCEATDTVEVEVTPAVSLNFTLEKIHDCFSRPEIKLTNLSDGGESYQWQLGDGSTEDIDELVYTYEQDGEYNVTLTGTMGNCSYSKSETVNITTLKVPNVFTANGDDKNSVFEIVTGSQVNLKLYNRWGRLVYENDDYKNEWDGEGEPAGIYYYEAIVTDETTCKGWLHLIK